MVAIQTIEFRKSEVIKISVVFNNQLIDSWGNVFLFIICHSEIDMYHQIDRLFAFIVHFLIFRCKVPECEASNNNRDLPFDQPWLHIAIPSKSEKLDNCFRYAPKNRTTEPGKCTADMFDTSKRIACNEFIYASDEKNIQTEVVNLDNIFAGRATEKYSIYFLYELELLYFDTQ